MPEKELYYKNRNCSATWFLVDGRLKLLMKLILMSLVFTTTEEHLIGHLIKPRAISFVFLFLRNFTRNLKYLIRYILKKNVPV